MNFNLKAQGFSKTQWAILFVAITLLYIGFALAFAALTNYSLDRFGAHWTDFWGWAVLYAMAPGARAWVMGR